MPFLLFLPLDVLADSVIISVDLPIYTNADVVTIYGNISNETLFQVTITSPEKIVVADEEIVITAGDFTHNVILGNYTLDKKWNVRHICFIRKFSCRKPIFLPHGPKCKLC